MKRIGSLVLLVWLCAAGPGFAIEGAPEQPFSFIVPVKLSHLHRNLTLVRARCWVLPGADWSAISGALGEGVSGPIDTHLASGIRSYDGEITVNVPLRTPRLGSARSYRCQIELYDAVGRVWGDAGQIDRRYPLDKAARGKTETGGLIGSN
jgi:hypothetical protein